uniref:HSP90 family molecular chaperone-like protein n=1 Tax=uncultured bacterium Contig13 TaxID=1393410 RepID=W0FIM1_9BACT|nr:HSP90 family molecular chaperone-like protein [uncultured bacterium Contig13]
MTSSQSSGYAMEYRLRKLSPELHERFTDMVAAMQYHLSRYKLLFPEFTDHSELHSLSVINYCNLLIGGQIERLNADELYILLMSCYLHDSGMGITLEQYREFSEKIDFGDYFDTHPAEDIPAAIRAFHHEFSGQFIRKYARMFEIPSPAHIQAIVQVSRGHRITDLMNGTEYPAELPLPGGNTACLPYLAAVIRLADEIDVTSSRNPALLFDIESLFEEKSILISKTMMAVRQLETTETSFVLHIDTEDGQILEQIGDVVRKMQKTLDYCRKTVRERTSFAITQETFRTVKERSGEKRADG